MSLAPEIDAFLKRLDALNLPQVWQAPIDEIRRNTQVEQLLLDQLKIFLKYLIDLSQGQLQIYPFESTALQQIQAHLPSSTSMGVDGF